MLGSGTTSSPALRHLPVGQVSDTQVDVFSELYWVFLILGTIVGVLVISYTVYNAYKYRTSGDAEGRYDIAEADPDGDDYDVARPERGEIPTGKGKAGGKKLFTSFALSAVLVLSLIVYSYMMLLYIEDTGANAENAIEVDVEGYQFGWEYEYDFDGATVDSTDDEYVDAAAAAAQQTDGITHEGGDSFEFQGDSFSADEILIAPTDRQVSFTVTSRDVFHNFGVPELRAKSDAIPGDTTETWFQADETGTYAANCYELCGQGHSNMKGPVIIVETSEFEDIFADLESVDRADLEFLEVNA